MLKLYNRRSPQSDPGPFTYPFEPEPGPSQDVAQDNVSEYEGYVVDEALEKAINVALFLGLPLLLTGEPGSGKTGLAYKLAKDFGWAKNDRFFVFRTRSDSSYTDLLYHYDALRHYQYAHHQQEPVTGDALEKQGFIRFQALGAAIKRGERCLVLIDEIDKAPRDLPNDVLGLLDELAFDVPEMDRRYDTPKANRPIVLLTSNSEKMLPDAFLRRCVYYHIGQATEEKLLQILVEKFAHLDDPRTAALRDGAWRAQIVGHFLALCRGKTLRKAPATAELVQWARVLLAAQIPLGRLADIHNNPSTAPEYAQLVATYGVLFKDNDDLQEALTPLIA